MKVKKTRKDRASKNSNRAAPAVLKRFKRELEAMTKSHLRDAKIHAAALAPVAKAISSNFPWLADAAKIGYVKARRLVDRQPPISRLFSPPDAGSIFDVRGCRSAPY